MSKSDRWGIIIMLLLAMAFLIYEAFGRFL